MIKKLAEFLLTLIFVIIAIFVIACLSHAIYLFAYMAMYDDNPSLNILGFLMVLFILAGILLKIRDFS
jgi:hypothetical protein